MRIDLDANATTPVLPEVLEAMRPYWLERYGIPGTYVPLDEQNTALWDADMIEEAESLLLRASTIGTIGRYQLEAAVQSAHAARRLTGRSEVLFPGPR